MLLDAEGLTATEFGVSLFPTYMLVDPQGKVVERGGVITFDVGVYGEKAANGKNAPYLKIPAGQFKQLCAVRDAVGSIQR